MVILENPNTGETRQVGNSGVIPKGWRVKEYIPDTQSKSKTEQNAKIAVWATKLGLPVPAFLDAARWLLNKDCPFCQLGTQILRRIDELGEEKTKELVSQILYAKEHNDQDALARIRNVING